MPDHVKVYGVKPRIQYVADGILIEYEFPFTIFKTTDIEVYFGDAKQDTSTYTVSEARHSDGGSVTFKSAPESGTIITIVRNLSIERTSDFQEGSTLRAKVLNDELDYQMACTQQIAENLNRSMVLPPYAADNNLDLTLPTPSAGKAIVWNSDGTNLENSTVEVNALESTLKGYKTAAETAAATATEKASVASDKADIATQKAQIATDKADEAVATLIGKVNKDMDNLSTTGKTTCTSFGMPSTNYVEIPLLPSQQTYEAPANGYFQFDKVAGITGNYYLTASLRKEDNSSLGVFYWFDWPTATTEHAAFIVPIRKGEKLLLNYTITGALQRFSFIYAQGEI